VGIKGTFVAYVELDCVLRSSSVWL
jgi:hypothetical protein